MNRPLLLAAIALLCAAGLPSPLHADFKPEIKYAEVNDVKLAYYIRGEGEPLLMINGFLSSMSLWDPLMIEELAKQHQLILFDNRGVGLSTDTKENNTTIPQMADDAAGLLKALGIKKANILAYSMGARIGQQLLIRHPDLVSKAVLCAADPGGTHGDPAAPDVEGKLNNPDTPKMEKLALTAPDDAKGKAALQATMNRIKAAVKAGIMPDDFDVPKQTIERQDRARTTLWRADNSNFENLKNIKVPVLVTDGRSDVVDPPKNSLIIANQIPFAWLAYFWGGHSFLYTEPKHFADTVNAFLQ
ncbi:MAG: alpha/beta hydrolase [Chthoniobacterales bacterium]|nr:alpha/beta hydrolase [Chthoniobacterales bacterium]